jgi:hypothetical protein
MYNKCNINDKKKLMELVSIPHGEVYELSPEIINYLIIRDNKITNGNMKGDRIDIEWNVSISSWIFDGNKKEILDTLLKTI